MFKLNLAAVGLVGAGAGQLLGGSVVSEQGPDFPRLAHPTLVPGAVAAGAVGLGRLVDIVAALDAGHRVPVAGVEQLQQDRFLPRHHQRVAHVLAQLAHRVVLNELYHAHR